MPVATDVRMGVLYTVLVGASMQHFAGVYIGVCYAFLSVGSASKVSAGQAIMVLKLRLECKEPRMQAISVRAAQ